MSEASAASADALRSQIAALRSEVGALSDAGRADADALGAAQARAEERAGECEAAVAVVARRVEELGRRAAEVPKVRGCELRLRAEASGHLPLSARCSVWCSARALGCDAPWLPPATSCCLHVALRTADPGRPADGAG